MDLFVPVIASLRKEIKKGYVPTVENVYENVSPLGVFNCKMVAAILCNHFDIPINGDVDACILKECKNHAADVTTKMLKKDIKRGKREKFTFEKIFERRPAILTAEELVLVLCNRFEIAKTAEIDADNSKMDPMLLQAFEREHACHMETIAKYSCCC